ncbi:hypothetical protein [Thermococcus sp.]
MSTMRRVKYILFGMFVFLIFGSQLSVGAKPAVDTALPSWMAPNNFPNLDRMVTPAAVWPGYGGGSDVAVIHYVRDEDENYYHTNTVRDILNRHGYSVHYWDAYYHGSRGDSIWTYYKMFNGKTVNIFYYYGHTAKIYPSTEVNGFIILQNPNYGDTASVFWSRITQRANFHNALVFILGCDSFKLRSGAVYRTYIGTDRPIGVELIKSKGTTFWKKLDEGKTAYQAMESIQPSFWERLTHRYWARFKIDGDRNWRL